MVNIDRVDGVPSEVWMSVLPSVTAKITVLGFLIGISNEEFGMWT